MLSFSEDFIRMNQPIHEEKVNKILLKPRFKEVIDDSKSAVKSKFTSSFSKTNHSFRTKIIDDHMIIDVAEDQDHFWSPQLQLELESVDNQTILKGLFGPKPQLWTLFMFIHFAIALAFAIFLVLAYTKYNLNQDYQFSLILCLTMPVLWILFYLFGQFGKKKGYDQMLALDNFVKEIVNS